MLEVGDKDIRAAMMSKLKELLKELKENITVENRDSEYKNINYKKNQRKSRWQTKWKMGLSKDVRWQKKKIHKFEDRLVEITFSEEHREKRLKENDRSHRDPWDNMKNTSIHVTGLLKKKREKKEQRKKIEVAIPENFPNVLKNIHRQFQGTQKPK